MKKLKQNNLFNLDLPFESEEVSEEQKRMEYLSKDLDDKIRDMIESHDEEDTVLALQILEGIGVNEEMGKFLSKHLKTFDSEGLEALADVFLPFIQEFEFNGDESCTKIPERVFQCKELKRFESESHNMKELPPEIEAFQKLEKLSLCETPIEKLPNTLGKLKSLKELEIVDCNVREIPEALGELQNLETLNISSCLVDKIPSSIAKLQNLEELRIERNFFLHQIPEEIYELQNLKKLRLSIFSLEPKQQILSSKITNLQNLEVLEIDGYTLKEIPREISKMRNLKALGIYDTMVETLPREIMFLPNLQELKVDSSRRGIILKLSKSQQDFIDKLNHHFNDSLLEGENYY